MRIKKIIKKIIGENKIIKYHKVNSLYNDSNILKKFVLIKNIKVYTSTNFSRILVDSKENILFSEHYAYFVDFKYLIKYTDTLNKNMTPDYSIILENSLNDLKEKFKGNSTETAFILELENYIDTYINKICSYNIKNKNNIIKYIENIKTKKCKSFIEAIQRILFFNQLFWQFGYNLCGLGRIDFLLDYYYEKDKKQKKIDENETRGLIQEFYYLLHQYYNEKSNCLIGDTGQIIVVGGMDKNNVNFENDLTLFLLEELKKFNKPEPKIFLRVNKDTSNKILETAISCIASGIGSPLISNDEIVIPKLINFGYDASDTWNYVPAACWEPSICGNSIDLNNNFIINLLEPLKDLIKENENFTLEKIEDTYINNLITYLDTMIQKHRVINYDKQPYLSLFIKDCINNKAMISAEIIKYKNVGFTMIGLPNVVNSILNIETIISKKIISVSELILAKKNNFQEEYILDILKNNNSNGFGSSNEHAIELTNKIINTVSTTLDKYQTNYDGKFKFGLSSPSYVEIGKKTLATYDGRKNYEPLGNHISSLYNNYLDLMEFATKIKYPKNCINGNVVDFIINTSFIENNMEKFTKYIKAYLNRNIYQLQINVLDSKTLMAAKANPELYKNLIVRVWGFSAYFNDLPEEYKDIIIKRAISAERNYIDNE